MAHRVPGSWGSQPVSVCLFLSSPCWAGWELPGEAPPGLRGWRGGDLRAASPIAHMPCRHRGAITTPSVVSGSQAGAENRLPAPSEWRGGAWGSHWAGSVWSQRLGSARASCLPGPGPISPHLAPPPPPGLSWVPAHHSRTPSRPGRPPWGEALPSSHLVPIWASRPQSVPRGQTGRWSEGC